MDTDELLAAKVAALCPQLNEKRRRCAAAEACALDHGGSGRVARASGLSRPTIDRGLRDRADAPTPDRVRRPGAGRPTIQDRDPALPAALDAVVEPTTRGDPASPLRWARKRTSQLATALRAQGHPVSHRTVADLLRATDYRPQAPTKTLAGGAHPDRDAQFRYLHDHAATFQAAGQPVISVATKQEAPVGTFTNGGRDWQPTGPPERVNVHDFLDPSRGTASPYGSYDVAANTGGVTVGQDHGPASFAVGTIGRWREAVGQPTYPRAGRLLICADGGGSNGPRLRRWKAELQRFAASTWLAVTVCHLPPGTSKWNKIEHRLFAHITMHWRGRPLVSHQGLVALIAATTTEAGLRVRAERDTGTYPTHVAGPDATMATLALARHDFHGAWNYTIPPRPM